MIYKCVRLDNYSLLRLMVDGFSLSLSLSLSLLLYIFFFFFGSR